MDISFLNKPSEPVAAAEKSRQIGDGFPLARRTRRTGAATHTDTKSLVSVAVSQGLIRSATHSATDQQLTPAESAGNAKVAKEGEGVSKVAGGGNRKSDFARTKFSTNAHLVVGCSELEGKQEGHASWCAERRARNASPQ